MSDEPEGTYGLEQCQYIRCRRVEYHTIADCPYRVGGPGRLKGRVVDAGGGYVRIFVDRGAESYPPDGAEVKVSWQLNE